MAAGPYVDPNPPHDLVAALRERLPDAVLGTEEFRGELTVVLDPARALEVARFLKDDPGAGFDMPTGCVAVHFPEGEREHEVTWMLYSTGSNRRIRLKVKLAPGAAAPSLTEVWPGMNWPEREQFDLVGVQFRGHPDLRRIIMPEDYPDHPLRKDFDVEGGPTSLDPEGRPASPGWRDMEHA